MFDPISDKTARQALNELHDFLYGGGTETVTGTHFLHLNNVRSGRVTSEGSTPTVVGKNLFDQSTRVVGKIKNDAGVEVNDTTSNYYSQYIPVTPGTTLTASFLVQRLYVYDADKHFLFRTWNNAQTVVIPPDAYFVQIQTRVEDITGAMQIEVGSAATEYEPFKSRDDGVLYAPVSNVFANDTSPFTVVYRPNARIIGTNPIDEYDVWEPESTTDDLSVAVSQTQATLEYTYEDLLAAYYDPYVGRRGDGHVVKKRSLGTDASGKFEVMEYDFIPKHYAYTVLINAGMNSSELPTIFGVAYFIKHLMEQTEPGMAWLYNNVRFKIIPALCPSVFDQNPKGYFNATGVNLNRNFNHNNGWDDLPSGDGTTLYKGVAPDSEAEVQILKHWLRENGNEADIWIDCHCRVVNTSSDALHEIIIGPDPSAAEHLRAAQRRIYDYYLSKGYFVDDGTVRPTLVWFGGSTYLKHIYAYDVYRLNAFMVEQQLGVVWYGSDPQLMNTDADIRNYVLQLRMYILALLSAKRFTYDKPDDVFDFAYQSYRSTRGRL